MASTCATIAGTVNEGKAEATVLTAFRHEHSAARALRGGLLDLQRLHLRASEARGLLDLQRLRLRASKTRAVPPLLTDF
jgi:hypothetical protein